MEQPKNQEGRASGTWNLELGTHSKPQNDGKKPRAKPVEANESGRRGGFGKLEKIGGIAVLLVLVAGALAATGVFTSNDPPSGAAAENSQGGLLSRLNPFAPSPTPTPLALSREYLYAGDRLLAVEDAGATAAPPADLAVWRPSTGVWWVLGGPGSQQTAYGWGTNGDVPVPGDYDGDGKTDFSIFRPSTNQWWIMKSSDSAYYALTFGTAGDKPAPADYDGDGLTDAALFRPSDTNWYILRSSDGGLTVTQFGIASDTPAAADYDGDGKADVAVWRDQTKVFYSLDSSNGNLRTVTFSVNGAPVSSDFDGDGRADQAVRSGNQWHVFQSTTNTFWTPVPWEQAGDLPVQNDYDGDGRTDIAVWRNSTGTWYIRNSADNSTRTQQWGAAGDIPVPAYYRR
ncbi:MAG: VCBS repeat-containing protein [Pyrinomonadaceae bacterium]